MNESTEMIGALVAMQAQLTGIQRTNDVVIKGELRYRYASLDAVYIQTMPVLQAHGFTIVQGGAPAGSAPVKGMVSVHTRLFHRSGGVVDCGVMHIPCGNSAQDAGSALTYARRYAWLSALAIPMTDDDAQTIMSQKERAAEVLSQPTKTADQRGDEKEAARLLLIRTEGENGARATALAKIEAIDTTGWPKKQREAGIALMAMLKHGELLVAEARNQWMTLARQAKRGAK